MLVDGDVRRGAGLQEPIADEAALVARAKALDDGAWETLFHDHYDQIRTYLRYRVGDPSVAEDLASQAFLEAVAGIGRYEYRGVPIRAWLFRIARNLSNDYVRRERGRPSVAFTPQEAPSPTRVLEHDLEVQQLSAALEHVTDDQRQVLVLRFLLELSVAETARVMTKSQGAIKTLQYRALAAARRALSATDPSAWGQAP